MDVIELNMLAGLQNKRALTSRMGAQQAAGMQSIANMAGQMAANATGTTPSANGTQGDPTTYASGALVSRSPTTNYHIYPQPTPAPTVVIEPQPTPAPVPRPARKGISPWWLVLPLAVILAGTTYLLWPKPKPAPVATAPGQPTLNSTIRWSQVP